MGPPEVNTNKFNDFYQKSKNHYYILYFVLSWKFFKDLRLNLYILMNDIELFITRVDFFKIMTYFTKST